MSWSSTALVPVNDQSVVDTSDVSPPEDQLDVGPKQQLDVARATAKSLIGSGTIQGDPVNVIMSGHSGVGSDDAISVTVSSAQVEPSQDDSSEAPQ